MRKLNNYNDYPLIMINNEDISTILDVMKMVVNGKADGNKYKRINFGRYTNEKFQEFSDLVLSNINDIKKHTFTCPICHTDIIIILNHHLEGYHNYGIFYLKLNKKHD